MSKLSTATPAPELVDAYLKEIALAYGVPWGSADEIESTDTNSTAQKVKVGNKLFGFTFADPRETCCTYNY